MTIRRMKTYTGSQGYVYQYYFVGKRDALPGAAESPSAEYIFDVTSDRKLRFAVSVFLPHAAAEAWAKTHGRPLTDAEQYGAVKMRLFQAFDEVEDMKAEGRKLNVDAADLEHLLGNLGVN